MRHLPREAAVFRALGSDGYSELELLVMEVGRLGPVNERHPAMVAEVEKKQRDIDEIDDILAQFRPAAPAPVGASPPSAEEAESG